MANSQYGYVRQSELDDRLLPSTFAVIRIDGKGFTKFSNSHKFKKPNDIRALDLMNRAARHVLESDLGRGYTSNPSSSKSKRNTKTACGQNKKPNGIILAYGQSDEFSFAFGRHCQAYNRRASKLLTTVLSSFTAAYIFLWPEYFPDSPLQVDNLPTFDGRIIQYATDQELRDYFKWRQVDAHVNNLYNTTFWALVQRGNRSPQEAHSDLKGSFSKDKHSILFDQFQINYNDEPKIYKKGSILIWSSSTSCGEEASKIDVNAEIPTSVTTASQADPSTSSKLPAKTRSQSITENHPALMIPPSTSTEKHLKFVKIIHEDLIKDHWWTNGPGLNALQ